MSLHKGNRTLTLPLLESPLFFTLWLDLRHHP